MAITNQAGGVNQFGGMQSMPMPMLGGSMPQMQLPGVQSAQVPNSTQLNATPDNIMAMLSQHSPQSLSQQMGPLLNQVYGAQGNLMQPIFAQQGAQNAAIQQSNAMKRGITGSSIESAGMQGAYNQSNQDYNQYIAQMLNQLVPQYMGASQFDMQQNNQYYQMLAEAMGQQRSQAIQMSQFEKANDSAMQQAALYAGSQNKSNQNAGIGKFLGSGLGMAGGIGLALLAPEVGLPALLAAGAMGATAGGGMGEGLGRSVTR